MTAEVLVELKISKIDKTFSYHVPTSLLSDIKVGMRVLVPFRNQKLEGYVTELTDDLVSTYELKDIIELVDKDVTLTEELLYIGKFVKKKTLCNLIEAYQAMLPKGIRAGHSSSIGDKTKKYVKLIDKNNVKSEKQLAILNLFDGRDVIEKAKITNISRSIYNTLIKNGNIEEIEIKVNRLNYAETKKDSKKVLSSEQASVYYKILSKKDVFKPFLLHGVTGSGKTEVYMQLIEEVLKSGKTALVLVPEISLTPQFISRFLSRFKGLIATIHSGLSDGEKRDEWLRIRSGEARVVIGARSAVFSPLLNLGIIIIDEEHSQNYKQENNPRYSAIDVALARGRYHNCPVVLGSATPSIESYTRALNNIYELLEMKNRSSGHLPEVELIDMKNEIALGARVLSRKLKSEIENTINSNKQVILLLNRRGFTTSSSCPNCGFIHKCPNCDIPLIYHKKNSNMKCHYCGYTTYKLNTCPSCGNKDMRDMGMGTEKLEEYIKENINGARTLRMDNDTTSKKGSYERMIKAFESLEYNILIGTQMIAKGLDFPYVTLVGVLQADAGLMFPDFRSSERTFDLLSQIAGRAGRGIYPGKVIFQGFSMDHYSIISASKHDYLSFYKEEMKVRRKLKYSPFSNLSVVKVRGKNYDEVILSANKIKSHLSNKLNNVSVLGPSSGMMLKTNNIYELHVIIKYKKSDDVIRELEFIKSIYRAEKNVKIELDISPVFI